ncbi:MAG TPA: hypothetical protein VEL76_17210 [Gemmataceae bacterium]|nr:hypothetical protein [Gemmataceae bacterium]
MHNSPAHPLEGLPNPCLPDLTKGQQAGSGRPQTLKLLATKERLTAQLVALASLLTEQETKGFTERLAGAVEPLIARPPFSSGPRKTWEENERAARNALRAVRAALARMAAKRLRARPQAERALHLAAAGLDCLSDHIANALAALQAELAAARRLFEEKRFAKALTLARKVRREARRALGDHDATAST